MSDKESILRMRPSGRWVIVRPVHDPHDLTSGDVFRVDVDGKLQLTRMEYRHMETVGGVVQLAGYYSIDDYCCATVCARRSALRVERRAPWW